MAMKPMWVCDVCGTPANFAGLCPLAPHLKGEKKVVHEPMVPKKPKRKAKS